MFITVSGMVGSGKTTAAHRLVDLLKDAGRDATALSFQTLPCFSVLRSRRERRPVATARHSQTSAPRWKGYRRRPLTAFTTLVYLARIIAFQVYRLSWDSRRAYVLNRYFYDLFAHSRLETRRERFYWSLLRALIPTPDVAILLTADPETIRTRRPAYAPEYVSAVADGYTRVRSFLPRLIELRTDEGTSTTDALKRVVAEHAGASCNEGEARI